MRPALSRAYIVATALDLVDRVGLEGLSMRRLGAELGSDPMAVYHYFPSKASLFDGIVEAVYCEVERPDDPPGQPWREAMVGYLSAMRAALRRHPGALPAIATRPINAPAVLPLVELLLARLVRAGAAPTAAMDALNCLGVFTIGHALGEVGEPVGGLNAPPSDPGDLEIEGLATMTAVFTAGYVYDPDREYDLGVRSMLDGIGARLHLTDDPGPEAGPA